MKIKCISLNNEYVEGWSHNIFTCVNENGNIRKRYWIHSRDEKVYYQKYKTQQLKSARRWTENNTEKSKSYHAAYFQEYKNGEVYKEQYQKQNLRRDQKGYIPLNDVFEDSEGHHISRDYIIFIPRKIHRSLKHNLFENIGMNRINLIAFSFLLWKQCISSGHADFATMGERELHRSV